MAVAAESRRRPPEVLEREDIEALLHTCSTVAPTGIRDAALIAVLWRCGLRLAEALALKPSDVKIKTRKLAVQHGKGDRQRSLDLDVVALRWLLPWMERRAELGINGHHVLFCTLTGGPMSQDQVRGMLRRRQCRAGLDHLRVHAHGFRHTFAAELVAEGARITDIRDMLGHASLATTDAYLRPFANGAGTAFMRDRT
jgi:integrase/recombinase XerC